MGGDLDNWGPAEISTSSAASRSADVDRKSRPRREIRDERLAEILRGELLPRLLSRPGVAGEERWRSAVSADPEALALNLVSGRTPQARAAIAARLRSGATPTKVLLEDLAPAARQ